MNRSYKIRILCTLLLISIIVIFHVYLGKHINLSNLKLHQAQLTSFIEQHYVKAVLLYMISYIGVVLCMLPITLLLNIAAGYFFGVAAGTLYSVVSAVIGAVGSLLIFRYLLGDLLVKKYKSKIKYFKERFQKNGISYLLSLQLFPITPFPVINICAALAQIPLGTFIWTTAVGIIPGTLVYTWAGKELGSIQSMHDVVSWPIMLLFVVLAVLALIPLAVKKLSTR